MPLIFSDGPQSGWERGTRDTNYFLMDSGPLLHQFCHKSLHSWVGRGAGLCLQDWTDGEVERVKVRAPCRPDFFANEWEDFLPNPGLADLGSVRGRKVLLQGPRKSLDVLLGPGQQAILQNVGDIALGVQFDYRGHKKQRWPPCLCDDRPNHDRLRIWHLMTIFLSVDDEEAHTWPFCWVTTCCMSNFFSSVNARFDSVPSAISCRISMHFWGPSWPHD